jgi:DNA-directed RNA polymerase specialized sigma24 family protein
MLAARLRTVLPPSDAEDVLQETFLAAWKPRGPSVRRRRRAAGCASLAAFTIRGPRVRPSGE